MMEGAVFVFVGSEVVVGCVSELVLVVFVEGVVGLVVFVEDGLLLLLELLLDELLDEDDPPPPPPQPPPPPPPPLDGT